MPKSAEDALSLDRQLCFAIYSTSLAFGRRYKPLLDGLGLTYPQYLVMLVLWEEEGLVVKDIGERLLLDSATLTPLLKRLEAAALITRERDVEDERKVRIRLTEAGRALREEAQGLPSAMNCVIGLSPEEMETLQAALLRVRDALT